MFKTFRNFSFALALFATLAVVHGCTPSTCDNIPTETSTVVRILNCVTDIPRITVFFDGKLYDTALYNTDDYPDPFKFPNYGFGWHARYISGPQQLLGGQHRIVVTSDMAGKDTLSDTTVSFTKHRQTLLIMGKALMGSQINRNAVKLMYLDDETRPAADKLTLARFVHAVPDLGALDVYFSKKKKAKPDLVINYNNISDSAGGGKGTGRSATDYLIIPNDSTTDGLLIVEHADTSNVILLINQKFTSQGFFVTVVVRGESRPICTDPIVSAPVLEDGSQSYGTFTFSPTSFGVRFVNALRKTELNLCAQGVQDKGVRGDIPQQSYVKFIFPDSVSKYWPLTPFFHGEADFFFNTSTDPNAFDFTANIYKFHKSSVKDHRYTIFAIDTMPLGSSQQGVHELVTYDSVCMPSSTRYGRVRIINLSPDHVANFVFAGHSYAMKQRDVLVIDTLVNGGKPYSIPLTDGAVSGSMTFAVPQERPVTVFIFPATATQPYVVRTNTD